MFKKTVSKTLLPVQLVLVLLFIVFEELVWESIAKPIYSYVRNLKLLQGIDEKLQLLDRRLVLTMFLSLFVAVEAAGLIAGVLMIQGMVFTATMLYLSKIPIAAFTFWMFRACEKKLLSFDWFRRSYEKIINLFDWIKSTNVYISTIKYAKSTKAWIKKVYSNFIYSYFSSNDTISKRFRRLYRWMKIFAKR